MSSRPSRSHPQGSAQGANAPPTYLLRAIIVTFLLFFPTGIAAIVYAYQARWKTEAGDYRGAVKASKLARLYTIVSLVSGIALYAIGGITYLALRGRFPPVTTVSPTAPFGGIRLIALRLGLYSIAGVLALALFYLGVVNGIAYVGNPLRGARRRARAKPAPRPPEGFRRQDVSARARKNRNTALLRFVVQLIGVGIAASGAQIYLHKYWYIYLVIGLAVVWAAGRFIHPAGVSRDKSPAALTGSHRIQAAAARSVASVMVVSGLAITLVLTENETIGDAAAQSRAEDYGIAGYALVILGALGYRGARRLGSAEASRLMLRDTRPPVLYLRSFGDDDLKVRTATMGRPSLVEQFSPGRFDSFEEVVVRHLSRVGPVVAINPPGTKLAPLGAARETLTSADWQSAVASRMARSSLIVCVAPPESVTEGFLWELQAVSASRYWRKTLIVVPPVSAEDLLARWQAFWQACGKLWPFTLPMPAEDLGALVIAFRNNRWSLITADRRSEWSYGAALKQAAR
jgi:hypothetical protein